MLFILFSPALHKFYVSLTEIRVNEAANTIEISMRMFPDDLDKAIMSETGINPQLVTKLEHEDADNWLDNYLTDNLMLSINGKEIEIKYLGKEAESDAIWCYLEADYSEKINSISIYNSLLISSFEDQKNIVQIYSGESSKGMLFDAYSTEGQIKLD